MHIQAVESEYCKLDIIYEVNKEHIDNKRDEVALLFKDAKINGFRKGKATQDIIKFYFKNQIEEELKKELAQEAFQNVVAEKNIKPFGYPNFTSLLLEESKFTCNFTLHKQPDFELKQYKGFDIPKPNAQNAEELAQRILQELRIKNGQIKPYNENDFVQIDDQIILDCKGISNGQIIDKLTFSGEILRVGQVNVPGFSENLFGMKCGEERMFELAIPNNGSEFANKTINFEVKLLMGSKIEPAPLDETLAKIVGLDTIQSLMDNVHATASNRVAEIERNFKTNQVAKRLIEIHTFEVPHWISSAEAKVNARQVKIDWEKTSNEEKEFLIKQAENSVKLSLILDKVRDDEPEAQLTQQEILNIAKMNISQYTPEPDKVFEELVRTGSIGAFVNRIKDEYVLDFLIKNCNWIE